MYSRKDPNGWTLYILCRNALVSQNFLVFDINPRFLWDCHKWDFLKWEYNRSEINHILARFFIPIYWGDICIRLFWNQIVARLEIVRLRGEIVMRCGKMWWRHRSPVSGAGFTQTRILEVEYFIQTRNLEYSEYSLCQKNFMLGALSAWSKLCHCCHGG